MSEINMKKAVGWTAGILVAIIFWVFCITFTITIISGQNKQIESNNANKETVTVYVEDTAGVVAGDNQEQGNGQAETETQKPTTNYDKYYMIDKAGNYVKGTLPYDKK